MRVARASAEIWRSHSRRLELENRPSIPYSEHYQVPQWQSRPRDTVFRGPVRGSGLAKQMDSGNRLTPH